MSQSAVSQEQRFGRFNLYDIFANFLPGAVLIFGFYLPDAPKDFSFPGVTITSAVVLTILAFVVGFGLQAIASVLSGILGHPFNSRVLDIDPDENNLHGDFASICKKKFGVKINQQTDKDGELGWLFKSILSDLENSPWSRTLRIQALHLAARGLAVAFLGLTLYYGAYWVGILSAEHNELFVRPCVPPIATVVAIALLLVIGWRARHFENDVVTYMISEFTMNNQDVIDD